MPNGAPYKVLDTQKCEKIGWLPRTSLFKWFDKNSIKFFSSIGNDNIQRLGLCIKDTNCNSLWRFWKKTLADF